MNGPSQNVQKAERAFPSLRLRDTDLLVLDGEHLQIVHRARDALMLSPMGQPGRTRTYSNQQVLDLYFEHRLLIQRAELLAPNPELVDVLSRSYDTFSKRAQTEMLKRLEYVEACDRLFPRLRGRKGYGQRPEQGYAKIAVHVARQRQRRGLKELAPPGATLRSWRYRWIKGGREMAALIPNYHRRGQGQEGLRSEVREIIETWVRARWLTRERLPVAFVHSLIVKACLDADLTPPSVMAVHRWIRENISEYERVWCREGQKAADAKARAVQKNPAVGVPLRVVEIDHTRLDLILVEEDGTPIRDKHDRKKKIAGRPWLTAVLDAETRMILGFCLEYEAPSWWSVSRALQMAMKPKDQELAGLNAATPWPVFGLPDIVKLDNGREFHSNSMKAAAGQLKIELRYCRPGKPRLKGRVERFFGEVARDYCAMFPGRTFANPVEKRGYDSEGRARLTLDEARQFFKLWLVDIYHNKPHSGLRGKTPLQRWDQLSGFGVRLPPNASDLLAFLGLAIDREIGRNGIKCFGLTYQSEELEMLWMRLARRTKRVSVKLNPEDLTQVSVLDEDKHHWIVADCDSQNLVKDLDLWAWKEVCRRARAWTPDKQPVWMKTLWKARLQVLQEGGAPPNRRRKFTEADLQPFAGSEDPPDFDVRPLEDTVENPRQNVSSSPAGDKAQRTEVSRRRLDADVHAENAAASATASGAPQVHMLEFQIEVLGDAEPSIEADIENSNAQYRQGPPSDDDEF
ncbi:MAG: DDE-type integrase/transposase/recombinase [Hyphomicrobiales bacterium]|nr:DDE-type integrase/transposase/recombinase [Hyphomicrobiales bacterium]MCC2106279.1 DDE-type integrase/transposase/recombinase [Hyphomicrobiales bacterium]